MIISGRRKMGYPPHSTSLPAVPLRVSLCAESGDFSDILSNVKLVSSRVAYIYY